MQNIALAKKIDGILDTIRTGSTEVSCLFHVPACIVITQKERKNKKQNKKQNTKHKNKKKQKKCWTILVKQQYS
jgi:hypothetical protein